MKPHRYNHVAEMLRLRVRNALVQNPRAFVCLPLVFNFNFETAARFR
jgi:hypothetical protein